MSTRRLWRDATASLPCRLFLHLFIISRLFVCPYGISPDLAQLLSLKAELAKANPTALATWNAETEPCKGSWQGKIVCDNVTQRVTELALSRQLLTGPIPGAAFAKLSELRRLDLGYNSFTGSIPQELAKLSLLNFLSLEANKLTGPVPEFFTEIPRLVTLRLSNNGLTGGIPATIGTLRNLTALDLGSNRFQGPLPNSLASCSKLSYLSAPNNQLTGRLPAWLGFYPHITIIELFTNQFSGSIPAELGLASSLVSIALDENQLSGSIPPELGQLGELTSLYAASNKLTGPIPSTFQNLTSLMYIDLSYNLGINGTLPDFFGELTNLQSIALEYCGLSGSIPGSLSNLPVLVEIFLDNNHFTGTIPAALGLLKNLNKLYLNRNVLSGEIPQTICNMDGIYEINFARNNLSGAIPACLFELSHLTTLILDYNFFTGTLPDTANTSAITFQYNENCLDNATSQRSTCSPPPGSSTLPYVTLTPFPPPPSSSSPAPAPDSPSSSTPAAPPLYVTSAPASTNGSSSSPSSPSHEWWTFIPLVSVVLIFFVSVCMAAIYHDHLPSSLSDFYYNFPPLFELSPRDPMPVAEFGLSKVRKGTKNFTTVFGKGSFGTVYLAENFLRDQPDSRAIVKRAHDPQKIGEFLFKCKIETLARARHRYLVNLLGFCTGKGERILVYEYLPNGTLFDRLHRPELEPLPWDTRVRIAVNVACALEYLHHGLSPPLVHRAVTSSNILLADDMSAKLSDFGLARGTGSSSLSSLEETPPRRQHRRTGSRAGPGGVGGGGRPNASSPGSSGSGSPSHPPSLQLEKMDVYGFGVVLLELITGQKAMKDVHITSVAAPFLEDPQMMPLMVDPQLGGFFNQSELIELGSIARDCVQEEPSLRPSMRDVLQTMEERLRLDAQLFDNLGDDDLAGEGASGMLLPEGYSTAVPAQGAGAQRGSTWGSIENFAHSIKNVLVSPRVPQGLGAASGSTGSFRHLSDEENGGPQDVEMSSLLVMPQPGADRSASGRR